MHRGETKHIWPPPANIDATVANHISTALQLLGDKKILLVNEIPRIFARVASKISLWQRLSQKRIYTPRTSKSRNMCISSEQYIARPDGLANNNIPIADNARPTKAASNFNKGSIIAEHPQNRNFHLRWVYPSHKERCRSGIIDLKSRLQTIELLAKSPSAGSIKSISSSLLGVL